MPAQIVRAGILREIAESHAIPVPSVTHG
jgi:hypothetical protein